MEGYACTAAFLVLPLNFYTTWVWIWYTSFKQMFFQELLPTWIWKDVKNEQIWETAVFFLAFNLVWSHLKYHIWELRFQVLYLILLKMIDFSKLYRKLHLTVMGICCKERRSHASLVDYTEENVNPHRWATLHLGFSALPAHQLPDEA